MLGEPRPKPKGANRRKKGKAPATVTLVPGIEERVQLRERWSHKTNGTAETHEHAAAQARREGSLARLVGTGAIDAHQARRGGSDRRGVPFHHGRGCGAHCELGAAQLGWRTAQRFTRANCCRDS
ncbi:hypothetical protein QP162_12695 [Sphingomonas aurantiaca]|uniref:hypothetical protein n=1 Tax=Sphingomonas aurantiaca TaxID=185949 RepID=UPI002FDF88EA